MKATVMESNNGMSVILTEDGVFRTVVGSYEVGSEIRYGTPVGKRRVISRIAAVAACLLMALSMGTYSYQNLMVYATVTLDGTAPIQLDLNRHDKVIGVKAIDEAGEALAEQLLDSGIKGEHFETALARAEQMIARANEGDEISILPHVQCKSSDKIKALTDMIRQEEGSGSGHAAGSDPTVSTEPSGTAPTADKPSEKPTDKPTDKPSESTAASETGTEAEPTASSGTEPSSEEGMNPQDEEEGMDAQDGDQGQDMDAQETETMAAQEAAEPAADTAADSAASPAAPEKVEAPKAPKSPAKDSKESAPAETPAGEPAE